MEIQGLALMASKVAKESDNLTLLDDQSIFMMNILSIETIYSPKMRLL